MEDLRLGENPKNGRNESAFEGNEQKRTQRVLKQQEATTELHGHE